MRQALAIDMEAGGEQAHIYLSHLPAHIYLSHLRLAEVLETQVGVEWWSGV